MRAIIPVAGFGSRLRPHTFTIPKVLLNVAGKPIIAHILDKIIADGFDEATIIIGHLGDKIEEYVRRHYRIDVEFVEQKEPLGLAHAISLSRESFTDDPILIILGDTIFDVNLRPVLRQANSAIGVKSVEDPRRFGVVEVKNSRVTNLVEKPEHPVSNLAIVGLYWIRRPKVLAACIDELFTRKKTTKGEYQLTDALQLMLKQGEKITTFPVEGWYDCGKPETLLATNRHLLEINGTHGKCPGVVIIPPVHIARTAKIVNSVIGPYATVAAGAVVEDSILRDSIISEDAVVAQSMLEGSIVGVNTVVRGSFKKINIGDSSEIEYH
ncbi:MAG TPA: sugar phosphate nucleotidyltransferase [Bacteroidota bacterium]|nr:sugar phosphate nucleotidyltransferase [Bacteroidota bacterium]